MRGELYGEGVGVGKVHPQSIFSLREMAEVASIISCAEQDLNPKGLIRLGGHPSVKGPCKLLRRDYMFQS